MTIFLFAVSVSESDPSASLAPIAFVSETGLTSPFVAAPVPLSCATVDVSESDASESESPVSFSSEF
jgi:hypothetical protein